MSVESVSLVLNHSRARGTAKLVLIGIANHDGDGGSWPSIATLARYANTSERSVQRALVDLVELGEVVVHANAGGTHTTRFDRRPNRYDITVGKTTHGVTATSPRTADGVTVLTGRGDVAVVDGVTPASPEPSMNHPQPAAAGRRSAGQPAGPSQLLELAAGFNHDPVLRNVAFGPLRPGRLERLLELVDLLGVPRMVEAAKLHRPAGNVTAYIDAWSTLRPADVTVLGPRCAVCGKSETSCRRAEQLVAADDRHDFQPTEGARP